MDAVSAVGPAGAGVGDVGGAVVSRLRAAGCVFAEAEAQLLHAAARSPAELTTLVERRVSGVPLEHLLGWAEFCGIRVAVHPGVFIPRGRTELLVRQAVALVARDGATVVDMCCGSGALGAAIATLAGGPVELHAADVDPAAVACARENLARFGGRVYQGDLCAALPVVLRGRVDVLVANVPYVPTPAIDSTPFWRYEPIDTLNGGDDGLDVLRRLAQQAPDWLAPGGHLLVETSRGQSPTARKVMRAAGLAARAVHDDDVGGAVVMGRSG